MTSPAATSNIIQAPIVSAEPLTLPRVSTPTKYNQEELPQEGQCEVIPSPPPEQNLSITTPLILSGTGSGTTPEPEPEPTSFESDVSHNKRLMNIIHEETVRQLNLAWEAQQQLAILCGNYDD